MFNLCLHSVVSALNFPWPGLFLFHEDRFLIIMSFVNGSTARTHLFLLLKDLDSLRILRLNELLI